MFPARFECVLTAAGGKPSERGEVATQIQYLGFQPKAHGRDYSYRVIDMKAGERKFIFTISNRAFAERHLPYQDAAGMCFQKLQKALELETPAQPFPQRSTLSDQELEDYLAAHRSARRRTW